MSERIIVDPRTGAVTHRRECDECGGEGEVYVSGCRYGTCARRCIEPCSERLADCARCGGEGEVVDTDCDCAECRAASGGDAHEDGETRDDNSAALAAGGAA